MDIADEGEHRALTYAAAIERQGLNMSLDALEAYAAVPPSTRSLIQAAAFGSFGIFGSPEKTGQRFLRLGWLKKTRANAPWIKLTDLGLAVLRELDIRERTGDLPVAVVLNPDDPMAYSKVIGKIAEYDHATLVDPYLEAEALALVASQGSVDRILTSRTGKGSRARIARIAAALGSVAMDPAPAIRISDELHDRWVFGQSGAVEHLGVSLNGVGKSVSVMTQILDPIASDIRRSHEDIWKRAKPLKIPARQAAPSVARAEAVAADAEVEVTVTPQATSSNGRE